MTSVKLLNNFLPETTKNKILTTAKLDELNVSPGNFIVKFGNFFSKSNVSLLQQRVFSHAFLYFFLSFHFEIISDYNSSLKISLDRQTIQSVVSN